MSWLKRAMEELEDESGQHPELRERVRSEPSGFIKPEPTSCTHGRMDCCRCSWIRGFPSESIYALPFYLARAPRRDR
jgi:hypothetical protein